MAEILFNHDGFGILEDLGPTGLLAEDAEDLLVDPLADVGITHIDWSICSTWLHNCRTRRGMLLSPSFVDSVRAERPDWAGRPMTQQAARACAHYADGDEDLAELVVRRGHERGLRVLGCLRLNHANSPGWLGDVPGPRHAGGMRIDFRHPPFHEYLLSLYEDLLAKGVDGLTLDFERKAPFFPEGVPLDERLAAGTAFVRRVRALTDKPVVVRVCHDREIGRAQGQAVEAWLAEGLVDIVVPATHNHMPDRLDWPIDIFLEGAAKSPRPCRVFPQIWPTPGPWNQGDPELHPPGAVLARARELVQAGADGIYFFNFCCFWPRRHAPTPPWDSLFQDVAAL